MRSPLKRPEESSGELYQPTGISRETTFQAIGRLRQEAQDEIERLLSSSTKLTATATWSRRSAFQN
jgi:hypothetical protein